MKTPNARMARMLQRENVYLESFEERMAKRLTKIREHIYRSGFQDGVEAQIDQFEDDEKERTK